MTVEFRVSPAGQEPYVVASQREAIRCAQKHSLAGTAAKVHRIAADGREFFVTALAAR